MLKLTGDYFGNLLNTTTARSRLVAALIADLSRMFKVHSSRIEIQGLALGSLLVNYSISQNTESVAEAKSVVTTTTTTLSQSQGQSVMINTSTLYASDAVPNGVLAAPITVASAAVTYVNNAAITATTSAAASGAPLFSSGGSAECGGVSCGLVVGGAAALAVIGIGAVAAGLIINSRRKAKAEKEFRQGQTHCPTWQ
jgi:hypothetical protein